MTQGSSKGAHEVVMPSREAACLGYTISSENVWLQGQEPPIVTSEMTTPSRKTVCWNYTIDGESQPKNHLGWYMWWLSPTETLKIYNHLIFSVNNSQKIPYIISTVYDTKL